MPQPFTQDDRLATIAACSTMGRLENSGARQEPFGPAEWSEVAQWLNDRAKRPGALLDISLAESTDFEGLKPKLAGRLTDLPARAAIVALELERFQHQGVWSLVRFDDAYPTPWREKLKGLAPPVIFGVGPGELLNMTPSLAIVGSRDIGSDLSDVAMSIGRRAASAGYLVISGGARGSDRWGMLGALHDGREALGILHGDLVKDAGKRDTRQFIEDGQLCLVAHVHPATSFVTGNAMARNRYIHALADATVVISTAEGSGGTWAGSIDNLSRGLSPLLVWCGPGAPAGNNALVAAGGFPFDEVPSDRDDLDQLIESAQRAAHLRATPPPLPIQKGLAL